MWTESALQGDWWVPDGPPAALGLWALGGGRHWGRGSMFWRPCVQVKGAPLYEGVHSRLNFHIYAPFLLRTTCNFTRRVFYYEPEGLSRCSGSLDLDKWSQSIHLSFLSNAHLPLGVIKRLHIPCLGLSLSLIIHPSSHTPTHSGLWLLIDKPQVCHMNIKKIVNSFCLPLKVSSFIPALCIRRAFGMSCLSIHCSLIWMIGPQLAISLAYYISCVCSLFFFPAHQSHWDSLCTVWWIIICYPYNHSPQLHTLWIFCPNKRDNKNKQVQQKANVSIEARRGMWQTFIVYNFAPLQAPFMPVFNQALHPAS